MYVLNYIMYLGLNDKAECFEHSYLLVYNKLYLT